MRQLQLARLWAEGVLSELFLQPPTLLPGEGRLLSSDVQRIDLWPG